jgi:hypothetical protein
MPNPSLGPYSEVSPGLSPVAATSADNAWVVGYTASGSQKTLTLHWNGATWTQVPSPNPATRFAFYGSALYGVAAVSASSAWAFGITYYIEGGTEFGRTLILRWNGATWTQVPSPNFGSGEITGSATTSASNAWAVGNTEGDATSTITATRTLILRWNGTAWTTVPNPSPARSFLYSVAATSADAAWAVGSTGSGASVAALILRWNGTAWARVPSPNLGSYARLSSVTAVSSSDAWAVGTAGGKTLILRWNGQMWSGPARQLSPAAAPAASPVSSAVASPGSSAVASPVSSAVPSPASSAVSSPVAPTRRQAAQNLAALVTQSGTDRAAITQAVNAVMGCSAGLSQDETVFSDAAASHQDLLGKLAALPGRSALPASMLQDLTLAWQASAEADQDFASWTQDEISHGCSTDYRSDPSYQAAMAPDNEATKYKKAFVALWTPIANEYGLPLYQYSQI